MRLVSTDRKPYKLESFGSKRHFDGLFISSFHFSGVLSQLHFLACCCQSVAADMP